MIREQIKPNIEFHTPVMINEVLNYLVKTNSAKILDQEPMYIDATVGGGGHTKAILDNIKKGIVIGLDCDSDAINYAKTRLSKYSNLHLYQTSYAELDKIANEFPDYYLDGVLFDLGVSYYQISTPARGFTYNADGPLDMRFNQSMPASRALEIIHHSSLPELKKIFFEYGEERYANKIAQHIFNHRQQINTTLDLVRVICDKTPTHQQTKTLARIFQALRIAVNHELENIKTGLERSIKLLAHGARLIVISYHSLEDRITKQIFRHYAQENILKVLTKKPIRPTLAEMSANPSARSSLLRAAEKI
jgi:16S rRNA (cytosine1402-N4)-methyltransferase